ncbi:MAG: hypothetical protein P8Y93_10780 [Acidobacteriota bacterium]
MRRVMVLTAVVLAWSAVAVAQFVAPGGSIPVVAHLPGEEETFWYSDVSIYNLSSAATSVTLVLFPELTDEGPTFEMMTYGPVAIPGGGQVTLPDVVERSFQLHGVKGGLSVFSDDYLPLVLASRTYTDAPDGGSFGQNVTGVAVSRKGWVAGIQQDGFFRTNVGIFLPTDPSPDTIVFSVTVRDGDGEEVGSGSLLFDQAGLRQKNLALFGVQPPLLDGTVEIRCNDDYVVWFAYASVVDQVTGDAVFRPAIGQATQ